MIRMCTFVYMFTYFRIIMDNTRACSRSIITCACSKGVINHLYHRVRYVNLYCKRTDSYEQEIVVSKQTKISLYTVVL